MLDYTAHMYSSKDQTSVGVRQAKEYTLHPPWFWLPDHASALTCRHRQRDPEALQRPGGGGFGGALPQTPEQKYRLITYPPGTLLAR
jgi:hypothetical protein